MYYNNCKSSSINNSLIIVIQTNAKMTKSHVASNSYNTPRRAVSVTVTNPEGEVTVNQISILPNYWQLGVLYVAL